MKRSTKTTIIILGLAGVAYMVNKQHNKTIFSMTANFNNDTNEIIEKLNSEEIQSKLKELEDKEWVKTVTNYYRVAAIQILQVKDSNVDEIDRIMKHLGLTNDNDYEILAKEYIPVIHKEIGI